MSENRKYKKRTTNCYTVPVDHDKFMSILEHRGLNMAEISRQMSRSASYIKNKVSVGFFSDADAIFIDKVFNINREDYAPDPEPEPMPDPEPVQHEEKPKNVYTNLRISAVDRVNGTVTVKMDEEQMQQFAEIIYQAVLRAWNTPA